MVLGNLLYTVDTFLLILKVIVVSILLHRGSKIALSIPIADNKPTSLCRRD